ncbi:MAG: leucine-rich repeat domain-containing protein [Clostridia bacterium]|nr:leucine-rich repeat domain-containing protein [Clostridia bacterium]
MIASLSSCSGGELEIDVLVDGYCVVRGRGTVSSAEIVIPKKYKGKPVTEISNGAFKDCTDITSVTLTENITEIGYEAFSGCTSLKEVNNTSTIKYIREDAFAGCTELKKFSINDIMDFVGEGAFKGTSLLTTENNINYVGNWAVSMETLTNEIRLKEGTVGLACSALIDYDDYGYPEIVYLPSSLKTVFLNDWEYGEMEFHFGGTKNEWLALVNDEDSKTIQCWTSVECSDGILIYEE